ncbi:MAG TPA: DUF6152 family protein [Bryobacteraceae bacterium]|nr:DUF6152 family protein [Bryobacteraceae bacterium]
MRTKLQVLIAGLGLAASAAPAMAHHSFAAEYDASKTVTLNGSVVKVEWLNPHIWIYIDAKDESGKVTRWQCEGGAPNSLVRNGWNRESLRSGDQVTISGALAKDASNTCNASTVKLADGRRLFAGSAESEGGNAKGGGKQ